MSSTKYDFKLLVNIMYNKTVYLVVHNLMHDFYSRGSTVLICFNKKKKWTMNLQFDHDNCNVNGIASSTRFQRLKTEADK